MRLPPKELCLSIMGMVEDLHDMSLPHLILGEGKGTHSSTLAWRIPGTGEPGGLPSMGSHRVGQG